MNSDACRQILEKIYKRDYDRWIEYTNEKNITLNCSSFYNWKDAKGHLEKDIEDIVEMLVD